MILLIEGFVSNQTLKKVNDGLQRTAYNNIFTFFISYSKYDVKIGSQFNVLYKESNPEIFEYCTAELVDVTQELGRSWEMIPEGYKSIARFAFIGKIPRIINDLPVLDDWSYSSSQLLFSSTAIHDKILNEN